MRIATADTVRPERGASGPAARDRDDRRQYPSNTIRVLDHGFVRLDGAMADDLSVVNGARVSFARRKEEMDDVRRGPDPLPDARPARLAVRAQRVPLPRPLPDLRGAGMVSPSHRLVQRVQPALCEGDRRLLRPGGRRRPHPGRQARRLQLRAGRAGARRGDPRGAAGRLRPGLRDLRRASSSRASPASSPGRCCRSAPTPSSTGRSTRGR